MNIHGIDHWFFVRQLGYGIGAALGFLLAPHVRRWRNSMKKRKPGG